MKDVKELIENGKAVMGLEFGSTRIKAVLIDEEHKPIATGAYDWENEFKDGVWTYDINLIHEGLKSCYADLKKDVKEKYGVSVKKLGAIGISGMMHGYLPFDKDDNLLAPFRTWRNTITGVAAAELTKEFDFNIPQRWSIAHLYQAILNGEEHVKDVSFFTTLAGYIHYRLSGEKVLGVGEASGMFPIDDNTCDFNAGMIEKFDALVSGKGYGWKLKDILPKVLSAGEDAGTLTAEGAKFLDPSGELEAGIPMCPPEGDAGTGMVATNSVLKRTGNVSAGTSFFAMVVLEKSLSKVHEELDMVTTPDGSPVAMAHCNNGTTDLNGWVNLFKEYEEAKGNKPDMGELYGLLYNKALEGDKNCGGLLAYNYNAGEAITGLNAGRPLFVRTPDAKFTLSNFMRSHLYASLSTLKIGCDILFKEEKAGVDKLYGHGGFFKTKGVGQSMLAAAMNAPVAVMKTAGEGGPWGMAILAAYMLNGKGVTLPDYLKDKVFGGDEGDVINPDPADVAGFDEYIIAYKKTLPAEAAAAENFSI
ncbi:MAG: FGGY-family carbohydrate kinase [Lachnospiraceae bacterium]|nr:FGGY-family carbohydrate kinase [Lachnospiraceae bacterium]